MKGEGGESPGEEDSESAREEHVKGEGGNHLGRRTVSQLERSM